MLTTGGGDAELHVRADRGLAYARPGRSTWALDRSAMTANVQALEAFIAEAKFSDVAWERRGLNPSPPVLCARPESLLNEVAGQLLAQSRAGASKADLKRTLATFVRTTNRSQFDTEEAEFFCAEVARLSRLLDVDVGPSLNRWLHGFIVGLIANMTRKQ